MTQAIWIDDAAGYMLAPLVRILRRRGLDLRVFTSYDDATSELDRIGASAGVGSQDLPHIILDLLIPRADTGTLDSIEVGFALARRSGNLGLKRVIILTVVAKSRVISQFTKLEEDYPETQFFFLEKTTGNAAQLVDALMRALAPAPVLEAEPA